MKITKSHLKQIIKEELKSVSESLAGDMEAAARANAQRSAIGGRGGNPDLSKTGFKTAKKPIPLKYEIAPSNLTVMTKEGPVAARAGDVIMTGTKGENWPIPKNKFRQTYDIVGDGLAAKKNIPVSAQQMNKPFNVKVSWSDDLLRGKPGDFLVQYGPGDYGVVEKEIFKQTYDTKYMGSTKASREAAALKTRGGVGGAMAAAGAAELSVHAIDSMVGPELKKLIARATGTDPREIARIPTPNLKNRLKKLVSPVTGLVDLGKMGASEVSLALGIRDPDEQEAREAAFADKISDEKAAERAAGKSARAPTDREMIKYRLKPGTVMGRVNEMKITKSQLKQIILEELDAVLEEGLDEDLIDEVLNDPRSSVPCREFLQKEEVDLHEKGKMPKKFSVKSGDKSKSGGLTAKGVRRYRRANPGSKLKTAVTKKPSKLKKGGKAAKRRKSFCSRMCGMKKKRTGAKGKRDPKSRINKALRKWNCNC